MMRRAFTLIELLVVISIVSLLSSVVMASLNAAREKARIGSGRYLAAQIEHVASDQAAGIWAFDECSGTVAADLSGNGNNATLLNGATFSSDTPTGTGCSLNATGGTHHANAGTNSSLTAISSEVTVMGWIKITTSFCYNLIFSNDRDVGTGNKGFSLGVECSRRGMFRLWNTTANGVLAGNAVLDMNKWYHLAGVYDGATAKLYVDGKLDKSVAYTLDIDGPAIYSNLIGHLGNCPTCTPHGIYVDNVAVYAKALTASEIGRQYAIESNQSPTLGRK